MIRALELYRSVPRYVAARTVGSRVQGLLAGPLAPLRLVHRDDPAVPAGGWARVRPRLAGICGSDLAVLTGRSSFYFTPLVSMPFVPGHEVVGELLDDAGDLPAGSRVVLDPVLSCGPRGLPACGACAADQPQRCDRINAGHLAAGMQTGYCADTGGGWGSMLVAHASQLHPVPDTLPDQRAVLIEPLACAVHAALRARCAPGDAALVVGAGTVGLLLLLALRQLTAAGRITVVAKHPHQRRLAGALGASEVVAPADALSALRRSTRSFQLSPDRGGDFLMGGVDVAFDCVGARPTLDMALRSTRAGGRVVLTGLPTAGADLTPLWFRELELVGVYASGSEAVDGDRRSSFAIATELAADPRLDGVTAGAYPLAGWREALDHALGAGRLGTLKVTFDPRRD